MKYLIFCILNFLVKWLCKFISLDKLWDWTSASKFKLHKYKPGDYLSLNKREIKYHEKRD